MVCADVADQPAFLAVELNSDELMDLLAQLIDKSLVIVETGLSEVRYTMLETIRQYARDRLVEAGGSQRVRDRHLAYFALLSGLANPNLRGKDMVQWISKLEEELDNLRSAMEWAQTGEVEKGLQIGADLAWFYHNRGTFAEGTEWNEKLLAAEQAGRGNAPLTGERALQRARSLRAFIQLGHYSNFLTEVKKLLLLKESLDILRSLSPVPNFELGITLYYYHCEKPDKETSFEKVEAILRQEQNYFYLSELYFYTCIRYLVIGDLDRARLLADKSLELIRQAEDWDGMCSRTGILAWLALYDCDYAQAEELFKEASDYFQKSQNQWAEEMSGLFFVAVARGDYPEAIRLGEEALTLEQERKYRRTSMGATSRLIWVYWSQGDFDKAVQLGNKSPLESPSTSWREAFYLGRVALTQGDLVKAGTWLRQATSLLINPIDYFGYQNTEAVDKGILLQGLAVWLARQGHLEQAARVLGTADGIYQRTAPSLAPRERSEHDKTLAAVRAGLGEERFTAAWQEGQALTLEQAEAYLLAEIH